MENAEEIFHFLEDFSNRKPKTIPQELNDYLAYVARTGDPVYQWCHVKSLFKEKLINVITDFYETTPGIDIPPYPNVDPFNYDIMKNSLIERLDSFTSAPFTIQRICELLTFPRKQYNRADKFMRAIEKNILVVSTREPGVQRHSETENGETNEPIVNGSDSNSEYNVDVEMEDMSWKENHDKQTTSEPQPGSSEKISEDDMKRMIILNDNIKARLKAKQESTMDVQDKTVTEYESVTPPELNVTSDESTDPKPLSNSPTHESQVSEVKPLTENEEEPRKPELPEETVPTETEPTAEIKIASDVEMKTETNTLVIPEIKVDDAEMTEQKLLEQANSENVPKPTEILPTTPIESTPETKPDPEPEIPKSPQEVPQVIDESSSDSKDEQESKHLISEISTSSEESSSSSDNTDGNSNSPKTDETHVEIQEVDTNVPEKADPKIPEANTAQIIEETKPIEEIEMPKIESENYSISDVSSELPQPSEPIISTAVDVEQKPAEQIDENPKPEEETIKEEDKAEIPEISTETKES